MTKRRISFAEEKENRNQGFTLIEIIIAVAVLAVLTALLVPSLLRQIERARETRYCQEAQSACQAVFLYLMDQDAEGNNPENWELAIDLGLPFDESDSHPLLPYMDGNPSDGAWIYSFFYDGTPESFEGILYAVDGYEIEAAMNGTTTVIGRP